MGEGVYSTGVAIDRGSVFLDVRVLLQESLLSQLQGGNQFYKGTVVGQDKMLTG